MWPRSSTSAHAAGVDKVGLITAKIEAGELATTVTRNVIREALLLWDGRDVA